MNLDAEMHNADSLTTIRPISRTNVQHAIIVIKKVILYVIVILKHKFFFFLQDLRSPSINHNHHYITNIRRQDNHQVFMAHPAHVGVTITISVFRIIRMCPHCHSLR